MSELIEMLTIQLFKREPCRKCLVKACCTERCDKSKKFNKHTDSDHIIITRTAAWQLVIVTFFVIPWIIFNILFN